MAYLDELPQTLLDRAAAVRLVAFDVDGTLTDGRLMYGEDGHEIKVFHVHDGLGIKRLRAHGIEVAIISARISHPVALRAEELGIAHIYQGQSDKRARLQEILDALALTPAQAAFVGDDLPDLPAMRLAGLAVAVANAHPCILDAVHWQTRCRGGEGAAREVCDLLLLARGHAPDAALR
ncbi:KdsC family phosphatase [Aerosticca soli]|jgi:3-deoxy-D-manno-octulosonate 8-phosphate phosphatase (KDO 8-P phosphatase)|uniref:3-deoxy-D-manno-octulosonate 8-phosphate phosphatase KdsC n=1 Tax=Aerosticca soli TaxID=2010829 RepID=A0A2Z6E4L6_9GAMM|nr:HAD-IIIA family hydrolase [Aerosticca soli]MDI3262039.1 HAD-IIIA family hydrolase [Fulvimonas sp.]BBD79498.1 3-deoxy-D-manno-octulosonate 8-phosphate phosphatase [Aerosticca soli]